MLTEADTRHDEARRARPHRAGIVADQRHADREQRATTITEEIALVTDISGVCNAGVTDHAT